ncbi:hypothetical protein GWG65_23535 [Bradyrhizobium sp. CSA207]|uniref:hypothetical protein n=1 Tax=Bradyrhizobium sp. CSA207 TaxID=2698826 RepID=UPI0023B05BAE|nr:hypothetical protein [Bradyrhizobium sp. CSA207]MDE5444366.1 hypothetical protein [Bradyrhizobium sp. CSA207]
MRRAGLADATYLLFCFEEVNATRAQKIGFVQEVVAHGEQLGRPMAIATLVARCAPHSRRGPKESALKVTEIDDKATSDYTAEVRELVFSVECMGQALQCFPGMSLGSIAREERFRGMPPTVRDNLAQKRI